MSGRVEFQGMRVALLVLAAANQAEAQTPAYEPPHLKTVIFGGYSAVSATPGRNLDRVTLNGWTASIASYQFFRRWGLTAEFGAEGTDAFRQRSYLFGGTYRALQRRRFALTGRILAGGTRWDPKAAASGVHPGQTAFTFGFGQAIDFKFSESFAVRVQPDLRFARFEEPGGSHRLTLVRPISVGLVYQFGRR